MHLHFIGPLNFLIFENVRPVQTDHTLLYKISSMSEYINLFDLSNSWIKIYV